ncbi:MAG: response regulator [Vulcanimicrobiota bacterium]
MEKTLKILLVEDEVLIAASLEAELMLAGYAVCFRVGTGEDAILSAERHQPDAVLMDIRLAGKLDGIEAAERIQESLNIPILFMTGYLESALKERAMGLNPLGFLTKPVRMRDIQKALSTLSG